MKKLSILCLFAILFIFGFDIGRGKPFKRISFFHFKKKEKINERLKAKFVPGIDPTKDCPIIKNQKFVVVIPSYNNEKWYKKNLSSVFSQNYDDYRVIYVDDASSDHTYEKVKDFVEKEKKQGKVTLIRNTQNKGAMENLFHMIHSCEDSEIIVSLDGDDWFAHDEVLSELNKVYANPDVWLTYGQNIIYPQFEKTEMFDFDKKVLLEKGYRKHQWVTSQLRTFYAGLFKRIDPKDLRMNDSFLKVGCDFGYMFPMLEMSGGRYRYLQNVNYIYNQVTPINDFKLRREELETVWAYLQSLPPYEPLEQAPYFILKK
ncbi:MAG: hypothetical protein COT84_01850 [Chlamydiae bacterium CG10_big_fil_rev_8_21_14_0_10_35_9]|nr:MAG: hypothetical protein COT84_01850 [Chlamydiae bacterium CG10_big_fil_rev_8_21_14_0_10_35_9]